MSKIKLYDKYGRPTPEQNSQRELAKRFGAVKDDAPHGLTSQQIENLSKSVEDRFPEDLSNIRNDRSVLQRLIPKGASIVGGARQMQAQLFAGGNSLGLGGSNGASLYTSQNFYDVKYSSFDRQVYPHSRQKANEAWRIFNRADPIIGPVIELIAELTFSEFQLTGEGVDGEIKETMEYASTQCGVLRVLKNMSSEFDILGEAIPQAFFDEDKGAWTHVVLHDPDRINVVYSPFIKMDPVMEFIPDEEMKKIATSAHPQLAAVRETMPSELLSYLNSGENIPLSPLHATFLARKLHPYDLRGTSVISRLWRTLILEDAYWAATLATARRASSPIKVVSMGDPATGTIPGPEAEANMLRLLAQAEQDPQAWVVTNYMFKHEMWGEPARVMNIRDHYDLIERLKLSALGVSKSFISGESSFSASAAGLTIFLQRLKARRDFFVNEWLIPKFFLPMAKINGWVKPSKKGTDGNLRIKRSQKELDNESMYIVPTIEWKKSLDPNIDKERIDAMSALESQLGIKISAQKKYACLGLDSEEEMKQIVEETKFKRNLAGQDPQIAVAIGLVEPGEGGGEGGAGGGMLSPGIPPEAFGAGGDDMGGGDMGGGEMPPGGEGGDSAPPTASAGSERDAAPGSDPKPSQQAPQPESKFWAKATLEPLQQLFQTFDIGHMNPEDEPWWNALKSKEVQEALQAESSSELWLSIQDWLLDEGYPTDTISDLENELARKNIIRRADLFAEKNFEAVAEQLGITDDLSDFGFEKYRK